MPDGIETAPWFAERKTELPIGRNRALKVVDEELRSKRCHTRLHRASLSQSLHGRRARLQLPSELRLIVMPVGVRDEPVGVERPLLVTVDPNGLASAPRATVRPVQIDQKWRGYRPD